MNTDIRYIFFDLGNTFRIIQKDAAYLTAARRKIADLLGVETDDPNAWFDSVIETRYDLYRNWALKYMCEAPEEILWTRWLAYDHPDLNQVRKNAPELTYQYRQTKGIRTVVDGGVATIQALCRRGYTLGIISDLVGKREVDEWLDADGLRPYFKAVQQSSVTYVRKPGPAIFYYALEEAGALPENSCYVGDNLNRDILGAKSVEFGMTVAVQYDPQKPLKLTEENMPDTKIHTFPQLLDYFPARGQVDTCKLLSPTDGQ